MHIFIKNRKNIESERFESDIHAYKNVEHEAREGLLEKH